MVFFLGQRAPLARGIQMQGPSAAHHALLCLASPTWRTSVISCEEGTPGSWPMKYAGEAVGLHLGRAVVIFSARSRRTSRCRLNRRSTSPRKLRVNHFIPIAKALYHRN
jgi:hypothetical protein